MLKVNNLDMGTYTRFVNKACNAHVGKLLESIETELLQNGISKDSDLYVNVRKAVLDHFNEFRREVLRFVIR